MLNAFPKSKLLGFSLIEMMVAVAVLAIMMSLAMPSYQTWLQNTQIRNATESIQNGLQMARGEAVKRNTNVTFVLLGADATCSTSATCSSWEVRDVAGTVIQSRSSNEGSKKVARAVLPAGATTITFNSMGGVGVPPNQPFNADGTAPFTQIDLTSSSLAAAVSKNLMITIGLGGNARMCDPHASVSSPSAC